MTVLVCVQKRRQRRRSCRRQLLHGRCASPQVPGAPAVPEEAMRWAYLQDVRDYETSWAPAAGRFPAWLRGAYLRNGPGTYKTPNGGRLRHLFDGYGYLTRWELDGHNNRARSTGRFVDSQAHAALHHGIGLWPPQMHFAEFGTCPGQDLPEGAEQDWTGIIRSLTSGLTDNANVNILRLPTEEGREDLWLAMSEPSSSIFTVDPESLRTLRNVGRACWPPPLTGDMLQTAHPQLSHSLGGLVNIATQVLPSPRYLIQLLQATGDGGIRTEVLAELPCGHWLPSWIHSFALANDEILVMVEPPLIYNFPEIMGLGGLLVPHASHVCLDWLPQDPVRVHVVPLKEPHKAEIHELPVFMFIHGAQASLTPADEFGPGRVEMDMCIYEEPAILKALYLPQVLSREKPLPRGSRLVRLSLPLPGCAGAPRMRDLCDSSELGGWCDFPQVDAGLRPDPSTKSGARDIFVACAAGDTAAANCIAKVDVQTGTVTRWAGTSGQGEELVGEPIVAVNPEALAQHDGVVITAAHSRDGASLVILDAESMQEVARWRAPPPEGGGAPPPIPFGVHGGWHPFQ